MRFSLILATLALSMVAFGQAYAPDDGPFHIGYAANLNIGDSVVNISNDGDIQGPFGATIGTLSVPTAGNMCANIYVFDPQEEEIGCCSCLVTPNGLNALSVKSDLISNNLTPAVPTSVVIKILGSIPSTASLTAPALTICNPATVGTPVPVTIGGIVVDENVVFPGLLLWGTTLEPSSTPGTYNAVSVKYQTGSGIITGLSSPQPQVASWLASRRSAISSRPTEPVSVSASPAVWALWAARSSKHAIR